MTLTIGSLFSGYAGLDLAVAAATGAETKWFFEYDDGPATILQHHFPDVPNYRDVTTADWASVPPVDIICGGSPCQDLSAAGKRAGMAEGTRSNLWVAMREAIATIRPRLVVWENVQGALSARAVSESDMELGSGPLGEGVGRGGYLRALGRVLGDLADLGYDAQWTTVRASDVGAPHHRARVFLVAHPADTAGVGLQEGRAGGQVWPTLARVDGGENTLPERLTHLPAPTTTQRGPDSNLETRDGARANLHNSVLEASTDNPHLPTPKASDGIMGRPRTSGRPIEKSTFLGTIVTVMGDHREEDLPHLPMPDTNPGGGGQLTAEERRAQNRTVSVNNAVMGLDTDSDKFGKYTPVVQRWEKVTGVSAPDPTELNSKGKPRLNAAFAEWMMGLPLGWVTDVPGVTRAQQLKAIGNGVCPQQALVALNELLGE